MTCAVIVYTVVALCSYGLCSRSIYSHGRYSHGPMKLGHRESFLCGVVDEIIVSNNLEVCLVLEDGQVQDTLLHRPATYTTARSVKVMALMAPRSYVGKHSWR